MDNVAPEKSDVIDGANNSSLYTKLYSGLYSGVKSPVIYTKVFSNRSWSATAPKYSVVNIFLEYSTQPSKNDSYGWTTTVRQRKLPMPEILECPQE